jgi:hypothetical protein
MNRKTFIKSSLVMALSLDTILDVSKTFADERLLKNVLILNNIQTANGRIYSPEILEIIANQINSATNVNYGSMGFNEDMTPEIKKIAFIYNNARIIKDGVWQSLHVDIQLLKNETGDILHRIMKSENIVFRPGGIANIGALGYVKNDYKLINVAAISKEEDALRERMSGTLPHYSSGEISCL